MKNTIAQDIGPRALFLVGRDPLHPAAAGGDLQAWQWASRMAAQGWSVDYVCQATPDLDPEEEYQGVRILRLGTGFLLALRARRHYRANRASIEVVYEDPIGAGRPPYFSPLYSKRAVIAVWHQVSADLLSALNGRMSAFALSKAEKVVARVFRRSLLWAPSIESAAEVSRQLKIPLNRIFVIAPTLATGIEIASVPTNVTEPVILCLGVMRPYKNFEHVIAALPAVIAEVPRAKLLLVGRRGSPEYEQSLRSAVEDLVLQDHVEFRFEVTDAERQRLMRDAAVLVLPSLLEGFGIVSIEANAEGTPVIASSGVPQAAVGDDDNGLRYEFGDVEGLRRQLVRLLGDRALRLRLSGNSLEHARRLTTEAVGPQFDELVALAQLESATSAETADAVAAKRTARWPMVIKAIVVPLIAAVIVAAATFGAVLLVGAHPTSSSLPSARYTISTNPEPFTISGHAISMFIGLYTGEHAVIQIQDTAQDPGSSLSFIDHERLVSANGALAAQSTDGLSPDGSDTRTLDFLSSKFIGTSVLELRIDGKRELFHLNWPNQ